jgi:hypothetical protein
LLLADGLRNAHPLGGQTQRGRRLAKLIIYA